MSALTFLGFSKIKNPYPESPIYDGTLPPPVIPPVTDPPVVEPDPPIVEPDPPVVEPDPIIIDITSNLLATWDASDLVAGALTQWEPKAGELGKYRLTNTGTIPPNVVAKGFNDKSVVRTVAANKEYIRSAEVLSTPLNQPLTFLFLVRPASLPGTMALQSGGAGSYLMTGIDSTGKINAGANVVGQINSPSNTVVVGKWQVIASVFNGNNSKVYLDGELVGEGAVTPEVQLNRITLFANSGANTFHFDGDTSKVSMFARALTVYEVRAITQNWLGVA